MSGATRLMILGLAFALCACGGRKRASIAGQADLLADDDVVVSTAIAGLPEVPGKPKPAERLSAAEATETRCVGFLPPVGAALIVLEERLPGEKGPVRTVRTMVASADGDHGLPRIALGSLGPDDVSEDEMFGDELEQKITEKLPAIDQAVEERGLLACQKGVDLEMGAGGFRRKVREVVAFPNGNPWKVSLRDGAVFAGPADGAAKEFASAPAEEGAQYKLTDVWFTTATPGIVAVISDASSEHARRTVVYVPTP